MVHHWALPPTGIEYIYRAGDTNLHAANVSNDAQSYWYFPYADGRFDYPLTDFHDFERMASGICQGFGDGRPCNEPPPPGALLGSLSVVQPPLEEPCMVP